MKQTLEFLVRLVLISLLALPTQDWFVKVYQTLLELGNRSSLSIPFMGAQTLYPFFILFLATPRVGARRWAIGILSGLVLYLLIDLSVIHLWQRLPYAQKAGPVAAKEFYTNVYYMVMHWLLPFALWIAFAHEQIEEILSRSFRKGSEIKA